MRSLLLAALNCFVRNEPSIATAAQIASARVPPARDVALVLIRDAERKPVNFHPARFREVKDIFVAGVEKSLRVDWFEMSIRANVPTKIFDRDRIDPVDGVLH